MERDKVVPLILEGYREAATEAGSSVSGRISSLLSSIASKLTHQRSSRNPINCQDSILLVGGIFSSCMETSGWLRE